MKLSTAIVLGSLAIAAVPAHATLYSSRATFQGAVSNLQTDNLEGLIGTSGYPNNYPSGGPGTYTQTAAGLVIDGARYVGVDSAVGYSTYLLTAATGGGVLSLNGSTNLVFLRTFVDVTLPSGLSAFGADFGYSTHLTTNGPMDVTFYLHDGTTASTTLGNASGFFGWAGSVDIDRIHLDGRGVHYPQANYLLMDNLSTGATVPQVSAVPEPSTLVLTLAGLLGIVGWRGRVRRD